MFWIEKEGGEVGQVAGEYQFNSFDWMVCKEEIIHTNAKCWKYSERRINTSSTGPDVTVKFLYRYQFNWFVNQGTGTHDTDVYIMSLAGHRQKRPSVELQTPRVEYKMKSRIGFMQMDLPQAIAVDQRQWSTAMYETRIAQRSALSCALRRRWLRASSLCQGLPLKSHPIQSLNTEKE